MSCVLMDVETVHVGDDQKAGIVWRHDSLLDARCW